MNWDQIEGDWMRMKGKVKEQWGQLTDDQLEVIAGKRDQLVGTLQKQYGYSKERVEAELDRWAKDTKSSNPERPSKH
ncbi:MAG: CsbD family protein [Betaproteobacteria bacterium]